MSHRSHLFFKQAVAVLDMAVLVAAFVLSYHLRQYVHQFYHWDLVHGQEVLEKLAPFSLYAIWGG